MRYLLALLCLSVFLHGNMAAEFRPLILDSNGKTKQFPNGTDTLRVVPSYGLAANVPAASADNTGQVFITTDTKTILRSNGTTWESVTLPSGSAGGDLGGTYPNPSVLQASDNAFSIYDETDPTKGFNWTLGNQTTGTAVTLNTGAQSASRVLSVPVLSGDDTVAVIGQGQTFAGTQTFSTPIAPASGGTGVNNGSFALTVPATGTANLLGTAQTVTAAKTHSDAEVVLRNTDNTSAAATLLRLERGSGAGTDATISTTGDTSNGVATATVTVNGSATSFASTGVTFAAPVLAPAATTSIPSIRLPHGTAPSSPTNGDVWTTTSGVFARVNGGTVGPLIDASSGGAVAAFYAKISSPTEIAITAGGSATLNRMHLVSGTSANYPIQIYSLSPSVGDVIGFRVAGWAAANKVYTIEADPDTIIGRSAELALVHTNVALLMWDGSDWFPLLLNLDTPWVDAGAITITATTTNPTKGTTSVDRVKWRRQGQDILLRYEYLQSVAGTAGSGEYLLGLPIGAISADVTPYSTLDNTWTSLNANAALDSSGYVNNSSGRGRILAAAYSNSALRLNVEAVYSAFNAWSNSTYPFSTAVIEFSLNVRAPMANW